MSIDKFSPFLQEIEDFYVKENFLKLKQYLECLELSTGSTTIINQGGQGIVSPWTKFSKSVPASTMQAVDTLALTLFCSIDYIISFRDQVTNEKKKMHISVVNNNGVITESVYARTGASIDIDVDTTIVGPNYSLCVTNNVTNAIDVEFVRLTFN